MPMLQVAVLCLAGLSLSAALVCPDGGMCAGKSTCCRNPQGGYDCCPLPKAECCPDHIHCCYEGTICDLLHKKCVNKTVSLPLVKRLPTTQLKKRVEAVICPDMVSECPDDTTCCELADHSWGCCPMVKAVCCEDKRHCCPEGTQCDLPHSKCVSSTSESFPMLEKIPAKRTFLSPDSRAGEITCPGGKVTCEDFNTCCLLFTGDYSCCPYSNAICCEDQIHCCPNNTVCDLKRQMCRPGENVTPLSLIKKIASVSNDDSQAGAVTCPGGKSSCPDSYTCCLLSTGDYGCCPYPNAICCEDHVHCCPSNTVCDLKKQMCRSGENVTPLLKKIASVPNDVQCPDQATFCPDETTCCKMTTGEYGCCPMPNAVCCEDNIHCCPFGTRCDLVHSMCLSSTTNTSMVAKVPGVRKQSSHVHSKMGAVPCNESVSCADGNTCCKSLSGSWACCPLAEAVCCEDHLHCCPHGTVCNLEASTCDSSTGSAVMPLVGKTPAEGSDNTKCDKSTRCPGKATCCKTPTGAWACCPLPEAVCCDDHVHCCPHGTVCNLVAETCDDPFSGRPALSWVEKIPALSSGAEDEKCDKQTMCPGGTTCCKKSSGQWACCPLPQAVCCSDHEHCCPQGYKCNVAEQTCDKPGERSLSWVQKLPALLKQTPHILAVSSPKQTMCDAHSSCPRDTTCCFMKNAQKWGCCPVPHAICCEDGEHCCPRGHTCEPHRSSCSRGPHLIPWFTKLSAFTESDSVADVKCDDTTSCASGTTCCKLQTGAWGCCPLVKAVCCQDHEHCCPQGYTCNMETGTCEKTDLSEQLFSVPQLSILPLLQDGPCDLRGGARCAKQDTCCRTSATEWACCPSPGAVCCPDLKHCCPAGFSCDLTAGSCVQQNQLSWDSFLPHRRRDSGHPGL